MFKGKIDKINNKYDKIINEIETLKNENILKPENDTTVMKDLVHKINSYHEKVNKKINKYITNYYNKTKYKYVKNAKGGGKCGAISKFLQTTGGDPF